MIFYKKKKRTVSCENGETTYPLGCVVHISYCSPIPRVHRCNAAIMIILLTCLYNEIDAIIYHKQRDVHIIRTRLIYITVTHSLLFFIIKMFTKQNLQWFQNGYPARRRSLVDDARFETIVVKQTKQSVLEEARQLANG